MEVGVIFPVPTVPEWHGPRRVHRMLGDEDQPKAPPAKRIRNRKKPPVWPGRWRPWRLIEPHMPPVSAKGVALLWRVRA